MIDFSVLISPTKKKQSMELSLHLTLRLVIRPPLKSALGALIKRRRRLIGTAHLNLDKIRLHAVTNPTIFRRRITRIVFEFTLLPKRARFAANNSRLSSFGATSSIGSRVEVVFELIAALFVASCHVMHNGHWLVDKNNIGARWTKQTAPRALLYEQQRPAEGAKVHLYFSLRASFFS